MTNTFGATSWDKDLKSPVTQEKRSNNSFMKLDDGDNVVRVITKPHEYLVHQGVKFDPEEKGYGATIKSSLYHGADPLCEDPYNLKPRQRWYVGVIERKTGSYKILDITAQVFRGIQALARDEDWGDPSQYDVNIKVNKKGGAQGYYTVIAKPKKPLSAADLELRSNVDPDDLKRRCTPPSYEDVKKRVDELKVKAGVTTKTAAKVVEEAPVETDTDVDDFDFPSADE